jgi:crotonobetainyl-CoA:carnitine CoA-transferase CaiB-like acyl-CoA transferase
MKALFSDLRILDLSSVLAGPAVATFFAELGAHVIKVEHPVHGDITRTWKNAQEDKSARISAYYASVNFGKQVIQLDLADASKRPQLEELLQTSDVVITNFKLGDEEKFALTSKDMLRLNSSLIHAKITGFAHQEGRVAYDLALQAETGMMSMNGTPESGPTKMPVAFIDLFASHQIKEGILCGLIQRMKTGHGGVVSCSLEAAAIASLANQASNYLMSGIIPARQGSLHPNIAPYGEIFRCVDGELLTLAVGSDRQFKDLCTILDLRDIPNNPRFADNPSRLNHRDELAHVLQQAICKWKLQEIEEVLLQENIPFGVIRSIDHVLDLPSAKDWILEEIQEDTSTRRVRTAMFVYQSYTDYFGSLIV